MEPQILAAIIAFIAAAMAAFLAHRRWVLERRSAELRERMAPAREFKAARRKAYLDLYQETSKLYLRIRSLETLTYDEFRKALFDFNSLFHTQRIYFEPEDQELGHNYLTSAREVSRLLMEGRDRAEEKALLELWTTSDMIPVSNVVRLRTAIDKHEEAARALVEHIRSAQHGELLPGIDEMATESVEVFTRNKTKRMEYRKWRYWNWEWDA